MPPLLTDYTFAFGDSGVVLNTDSTGFPFLDVTDVKGLDGAPLRQTLTEHQGQDGTFIDAQYMSLRTVVVIGTLYTNPTDPDTLLDTLRAEYCDPTIKPFYFQLPGKPTRFVNGQGGGCAYDIDTNRRLGITPIQITVLAGDPYIYDYPAISSMVSVPTVISVGTGFNMSFNVGFGGSVPNNSATVFNAGTHTAYPVITITGSCVNPVLIDGFGITMAMTLTMSAGDQLVIDCRQKSIVLNGTVSRRSAMAGIKWFSVPTQMSETVFFGADSGTATATVSLNGTYY